MSNLYIITRPDTDVDYDEAAGFAVIADNEHQARSLIANADLTGPGDEGRGIWRDHEKTICRSYALYLNYEHGILLRDFRAG